jgi:hypothetical protein
MRGASAVVLVSPAIPAQELNVVGSAAGAGVGHVVKITSKASADSPIARRRDQTEIENGLIASGLGYTLLRNNAYMQNFLMLAPAIAETGSFGSSTGDGRVGMVDTRDVLAHCHLGAGLPGREGGRPARDRDLPAVEVRPALAPAGGGRLHAGAAPSRQLVSGRFRVRTCRRGDVATAVAQIVGGVMSVAMTVSPFARKRSTRTEPMPPAAPVMTTTRSCFTSTPLPGRRGGRAR